VELAIRPASRGRQASRLIDAVFTGCLPIIDLQAAIKRYLKQHNDDPKPFVWTKPAMDILAKVNRLPAPSV
jgi:hypothetical protein